MMFSADRIADIQGFNKVYQNLLKQIDAAILKTRYTLTEKDVLPEISKTECCTVNISTGKKAVKPFPLDNISRKAYTMPCK